MTLIHSQLQNSSSYPAKSLPATTHPNSLGSFSLNVFRRNRSRHLCKTNCRSIEIPLLLPSSSTEDETSQEKRPDLNMTPSTRTTDRSTRDVTTFPFLSLPFELRLQIYELLLPARSHTLVTQYPHNGSYYTSSPPYSAQQLYPATSTSSQQPASETNEPQLTSYRLLNANFGLDFPRPSICPEILRTCSQIRREAEPVLYGSPQTIFDFGSSIDAIIPFLSDRSAIARQSIANLKLAREIPHSLSEMIENEDGQMSRGRGRRDRVVVEALWQRVCMFLRDECVGLRVVDLTVWTETSNVKALTDLISNSIPTGTSLALASELTTEDDAGDPLPREEDENDSMEWHEWEWTRGLLMVGGLRNVKVTWWGFETGKVGFGRFNGWLGRKMMQDELVQDQAI